MRHPPAIRWLCCLILLQGIGLTASAQQTSRREFIEYVEPVPTRVFHRDGTQADPQVEELPISPTPDWNAGPPVHDSVIDADLVPLPSDIVERALLAAGTELDRPWQGYPSLGTDRVPFALFELDPARPQNAMRLRFDAGFDVNQPNRSLYFGPEALKDPLDYQDYRFYREISTGRASAFMEYGLRGLDPRGASTDFESTALTDMQLGTKAMLLDGPDLFLIPTPRNAADGFVLSSIFRSHIPFGPALEKRGTSTGHFSLEPGLLANYEFSPFTHLHGQTTLWIPLGADKALAGEVLKWGIGVSHMHYSGRIDFAGCENAALISSLEIVGWEFLSGEAANDASVVVIEPGVRAVLGHQFELGVSAAVTPTRNRIYGSLFRFEMRWFW